MNAEWSLGEKASSVSQRILCTGVFGSRKTMGSVCFNEGADRSYTCIVTMITAVDQSIATITPAVEFWIIPAACEHAFLSARFYLYRSPSDGIAIACVNIVIGSLRDRPAPIAVILEVVILHSLPPVGRLRTGDFTSIKDWDD